MLRKKKKGFKGNEHISTGIVVYYIQKCQMWKWLYSTLVWGKQSSESERKMP